MKTRQINFTAILGATIFATLILFAPVVARAQGVPPIILKPGEIIYGRFVTNPNSGPNCSTTSVWAVGQNGSNDRRLFSNGVHPRISPDGRYIMFKRFDPSALCIPFSAGAEIWVRELATGRETLITNFTQPFGTFFTLETNRGNNQIMFDTGGTVCRVNLDGTNRVCSLLAAGANTTHPSVRGGDYLSVMANEQGGALGGLYTFNYNVTNPQKVPNTSATDESPSWSNDGQKIAYGFVPPPNDNPPFYADLYKINADGSNKTRLTFLNGTNGGSPNGFRHSLVWTTNSVGDEFIYNVVNVNDVAGIYRITTDGSGNMTRIPISAGNTPDWVGGIVPAYSEQQVASLGGGKTSGGNFTLVDTIGQAFAGQTSNGGAFNLKSGFWAGIAAPNRTPFDFDGDGKSDISVFRPSNSSWYINGSQSGFYGLTWGLGTDQLAPADYDGDGKSDVAIWRESEGNFYIINSSDNSIRVENFGLPGDILTVGDWDNDNKADLSVYREGSQSNFFYRGSKNNPNGNITYVPWGRTGDKPVNGDFDSDGIQDEAVFRPSNAIWYIRQSSNGQIRYVNFGLATDKIVPADYDGDSKTDIAVFRDGIWYILKSSDNQIRYEYFGLSSDRLVPADYDGDGKTDIAIFRNGVWYVNQSTNGFTIMNFGLGGDKPIPNAYVQQ